MNFREKNVIETNKILEEKDLIIKNLKEELARVKLQNKLANKLIESPPKYYGFNDVKNKRNLIPSPLQSKFGSDFYIESINTKSAESASEGYKVSDKMKENTLEKDKDIKKYF